MAVPRPVSNEVRSNPSSVTVAFEQCEHGRVGWGCIIASDDGIYDSSDIITSFVSA